MKESSNFISLLIINFILFLLLFFIVEGVFRVAGIPYKIRYIPNESSFARFDPELGWSYQPDKSNLNRTDGKTVPVYLDKDGIRVPDPNVELDYSKPSILFIGGSFTMGHGLTYEDSFVGQLDAITEEKYQIVNLGVQAYGTDQALLTLKRYLTKFKTKIVVYTFIEDHILRNGNFDRRTLIPTARFLGTKPQFALNEDNELYQKRKPVLYTEYVHSFFFDFLKIRMGKLLNYSLEYKEKLTRAIIQELKTYSNDNGVRFVVLNWRWKSSDHDRLFKNLDIDIIDTIEDAPAGWEKMVISEGVHPNEKASKHAARLLHQYMKKANYIQQEVVNQ